VAKLLLDLKYYDEEGRVKPSFILNFCVVFLCRSILLYGISFSLRQDSGQLLALFYSDKNTLYWGMIMSLPALLAYLLLAFREFLVKKHLFWAFHLIKPLFLFSCVLDIGLHYTLAKMHYWQFSWSIALSFLTDFLIGFYLLKDRHLRHFIDDWSKRISLTH
jgi:hypothetical protein